ncbi:TerC family protein [Desulfobacter postgatei]|uniref:Membrane protein TerC, possibly involved in tellurium resistance n=1 Tax=Desulfobacter postgatei 2ac9 TaxID=879212 RepID=I5B3Q6_9BACT|nr:TerC family protein [Desulfobacter postgatei]EIM64119.1 membrane protein TerC, possibly involved in tellurium resistance [Desulfobacter postgatei 2ac9]
MTDSLAMLALLIGLELVLGIDNILVISILVSKIEKAKRDFARILGLALAMAVRILMLFILLKLASLTNPIILLFSIRDLILMAGGMFLLWKAVSEIHHTIEKEEELDEEHSGASVVMTAVVSQIVLLDIVFSVDSVITAIGLTDKVWVIITAVIASFAVLLFFAKPVGEFILKRPSIKILALSFLITIGITIFMEGMHKHVPKAYIYLPMGFALFVEALQLRYEHNKVKKKKVGSP